MHSNWCWWIAQRNYRVIFMMYKYCHFESTHNYQQMSLKIFYIQYGGVNGLFNSNTWLLLLAVLHELLLWIGVCWQISWMFLNIWCSWASWTSHLIYLSTQTQKSHPVSFLVLQGRRHWAGDHYPCDHVLGWDLHTKDCSWSQAGHTAKPR